MLVHIPKLLTPREVEDIRDTLAKVPWEDGRETAGYLSAPVKNNAQLHESNPAAQHPRQIIMSALEKNPLFMSAALPQKIVPPLFNRYAGEQSYGSHIDGAIRSVAGTGHRVRTDLSATVFLMPPEDYDGGELIVNDTFGPRSIKLAAGDMILYPGTSVHRVAPVTRGTRLASFFWIQSMVREDAKRAQLFELDNAIQALARDVPDHPSLVQLAGHYHNLLRLWADA